MTLDRKVSEYEEAKNFHQWLSIKDIKHSAIPNETGGSPEAKRRAIRMKRQGTSRGVPDYLMLIAPEQSKDGEGYCLFIELKRLKGGKVSPEQQSWLDALNQTPVHAYLAKGCDAAIKIVEHYLKEPKGFKF